MTKLPDLSSEFQFQTSRSSGAGGQNVNKVETKVEVRFDLASTQLFTEFQKEKITKKLASKLTIDGVLIVTSQASRSQLTNKETAVKKLCKLLEKALQQPKKRKPTKPGKGAIEKRLKVKKNHSLKKTMRSKPEY